MAGELHSLPQELRYYEILSRLDPSSLLNYCHTNKDAKRMCDDPQFWQIYLKRIDHYEWEDLLILVAYNGDLSLFLTIYEKGTNLGQITDLSDLKRCYFYFIEQGFSETSISKISDAFVRDFKYQIIKNSIDELKNKLIPMLDRWGTPNGTDIRTDYIRIILRYDHISAYLPEDYLGDFIIWNTPHLNYIKFLSLNIYASNVEKWERILKLEHASRVDKFLVRDSVIKALLRNGYIEIVKDAVTKIRSMIKRSKDKDILLQFLDAALAEESTLEEFNMLGGNFKSFEFELPNRITHEEMFKHIAEAYLSYIDEGYISMTPDKWLSFFTERTKKNSNSRKKELIQNAIDEAMDHGYAYWALTIERSPLYVKLNDL